MNHGELEIYMDMLKYHKYHTTDTSITRPLYDIKKEANIKNVIFNDPATIVFWYDGTKTVVKASNEEFDPEKGLAMAIAKKALGNEGNYFNEFKKWLPEESKDINNPDNNLSKLAEGIKQVDINMSSTINKLQSGFNGKYILSDTE